MAVVDHEEGQFLVTLEDSDVDSVMDRFLSRKRIRPGTWVVHPFEVSTILDYRFATTDAAETVISQYEKSFSLIEKINRVEPYHTFSSIKDFKGELRPHQHNAVYALSHGIGMPENECGFINADPVGTGKTIETIAACCEHGDAAIVVCEANKVEDWATEFRRFSDLPCLVMGNEGKDVRKSKASFMKPEQRKQAYLSWKQEGWRILIIPYEKLRQDTQWIEAVARFGRTRIYLDEATKIKNITSQIHKAARRVGEHCVGGYALSATMYKSSLMDYYAALRFIMPGVVDDFFRFQHRYCIKHERLGFITGYINVAEFRKRIAPFWIARTKKAIDIINGATKKRYRHYKWMVDSTPTAWNVYNAIGEKVEHFSSKIKDMKARNASPRELDIVKRKKQNQEMQQLRCMISPVLCGFAEEESNEKFRRLCDIVLYLKKHGRRAIVFSRWEDTIHWIESLKPPFTFEYGMGGKDLTGRSVEQRIDDFRNGSADVIIGTSALERGHNMGFCDAVIHLDMPASTEAFDQRNGRIDRSSEDRILEHFYIVVRNSRESGLFQKMLDHLQMAARLKSDTVGGQPLIETIHAIEDVDPCLNIAKIQSNY